MRLSINEISIESNKSIIKIHNTEYFHETLDGNFSKLDNEHNTLNDIILENALCMTAMNDDVMRSTYDLTNMLKLYMNIHFPRIINIYYSGV